MKKMNLLEIKIEKESNNKSKELAKASKTLECIGSSVSRGNHFRPGDSPSVATDVQNPSFSNADRKKVTFADVVKRGTVNSIC